jgi:PAS domain S-box-containing protein
VPNKINPSQHSLRDSPALHAQKVKYDALVESIGEGLMVIDQDGIIERVNSYALAALRYQEADLVGKWFPGVVRILNHLGVIIDPFSRPITKALTEGTSVTEHANMVRKDGSVLPAIITASPILIDGKPAGAIELFRDLSREQELDIAKDEFVSIASHQLRTPATGIRGILSMVLAGDFGQLNPMQRHFIEMAGRSNDRQLHIIEDLLSVARADSGRMDLHINVGSITRVIEDVIAEHAVALAASEQTLTADLLPGLTAEFDSEKIAMVIDNIITNARKYTPAGGSIKVKLDRVDKNAYISIKDNGVGIPSDKLGAIFTKFMRIENNLSAPAGGTGLGLYLAQKIVNMHGGDITVASVLGQGSDFRIQLPLLMIKEAK